MADPTRTIFSVKKPSPISAVIADRLADIWPHWEGGRDGVTWTSVSSFLFSWRVSFTTWCDFLKVLLSTFCWYYKSAQRISRQNTKNFAVEPHMGQVTTAMWSTFPHHWCNQRLKTVKMSVKSWKNVLYLVAEDGLRGGQRANHSHSTVWWPTGARPCFQCSYSLPSSLHSFQSSEGNTRICHIWSSLNSFSSLGLFFWVHLQDITMWL